MEHERSRKRSEASRKSGERPMSGERVRQKTIERETGDFGAGAERAPVVREIGLIAERLFCLKHAHML